MEQTNWLRVEGVMVSPDSDVMELADYLKRRSVLVQLVWCDSSPELVRLRVASNGKEVATLTKRAKIPRPGVSVEELVENLATDFAAKVVLGDVTVDKLSDDMEMPQTDVDSENGDPVRILEIGDVPSSAVPLMAAFEGADIAELGLSNGKRLLAAQLPARRSNWYFGDVPLVTLTARGDKYQVSLMREDTRGGSIAYNWAMNQLVVVGAKGWEGEIPETVHRLVGSLPTIEAISQEVPGTDVEEAFKASLIRGPQAVRKFGKALGVDDTAVDYLLGTKPLEHIEGAHIHRARGISNAIGRSVDMIIDERQSESHFWEIYTSMIRSRPWLVPLVSALEFGVGLGLLFISRKTVNGKRNKMGTALGVLFLMDSVAENMLAKYTTVRAERREVRKAGTE